MINFFLETGQLKEAAKLQKTYDETNVSKPNIEKICPEFDERFVKQDWNNNTSFDGFITLTSLGNKLKIQIPVKRHKHFNKLDKKGTLLKGIRLSKTDVTFNFEMPDIPKKKRGKALGLDMGIKKTFVCSDKQKPISDNHGHTLDSITKRMSNKQKGSKAFKNLQTLRKTTIRQNINKLNLTGISQLNIEDLYNMRKGRYVSRQLSHFTYTEIVDKLQDYCYENGVRLVKVPAFYTSQRCSACGYVKTSNRKGESFECKACHFICDADYNASLNIQKNLPNIEGKVNSRKGFYWCKPEAETIVPLPKN